MLSHNSYPYGIMDITLRPYFLLSPSVQNDDQKGNLFQSLFDFLLFLWKHKNPSPVLSTYQKSFITNPSSSKKLKQGEPYPVHVHSYKISLSVVTSHRLVYVHQDMTSKLQLFLYGPIHTSLYNFSQFFSFQFLKKVQCFLYIYNFQCFD